MNYASVIARWAHIEGPQDCWPFRLKTTLKSGNGTCLYGQVSVGNRRRRAHRAAYEVAFGQIPPGAVVCHRCDNSLCCNPAHLFVGSVADNNRDKMAKGRHRALYALANPAAKLSDEQAAEIRKRALAGEKQRVIAAEYGIDRALVSMLKTGRARPHLKG